MAANIKNILEILQQKIANASVSDTTEDLITLFKAAKKAGGSVIRSIDSDGELTSMTSSTDRIVFSRAAGGVRFNNNSNWDYAVGDPASQDGTPSYVYGGEAYGYNGSGWITAPSTTITNKVSKVSFVSGGNAVQSGTLGRVVVGAASASSKVAGYNYGGYSGPIAYSTVEKFPFATDNTFTNVGTVTATQAFSPQFHVGAHSQTHAYSMERGSNEKFPFAADGAATLVGLLTVPLYRGAGAGISSDAYGYGYLVGGNITPNTYGGSSNVIEKFSFIVDATSLDVADTTRTFYKSAGGISSQDYGYTVGNESPAPNAIGNGSHRVDKFPFASNQNATYVLDLTVARGYITGTSSVAEGYTMGGRYNSTEGVNTIDKFPFASDVNATYVGADINLRGLGTGNQI